MKSIANVFLMSVCCIPIVIGVFVTLMLAADYLEPYRLGLPLIIACVMVGNFWQSKYTIQNELGIRKRSNQDDEDRSGDDTFWTSFASNTLISPKSAGCYVLFPFSIFSNSDRGYVLSAPQIRDFRLWFSSYYSEKEYRKAAFMLLLVLLAITAIYIIRNPDEPSSIAITCYVTAAIAIHWHARITMERSFRKKFPNSVALRDSKRQQRHRLALLIDSPDSAGYCFWVALFNAAMTVVSFIVFVEQPAGPFSIGPYELEGIGWLFLGLYYFPMRALWHARVMYDLWKFRKIHGRDPAEADLVSV